MAEPTQTPRWRVRTAAGVACIVAALALVVVGLFFVLLAVGFADGEEEFPIGFWQELLWFALPISGLVASTVAVPAADAVLDSSGSFARFGLLGAGAAASYAAFFAYAGAL